MVNLNFCMTIKIWSHLHITGEVHGESPLFLYHVTIALHLSSSISSRKVKLKVDIISIKCQIEHAY